MPDKNVSRAQLEARAILALRHAQTIAMPEDSHVTIARRVLLAEQELTAALAPLLLEEHYRRILDRHDPRQPFLPGVGLPPRIAAGPKASVPKVALQDATLPQLRAYRKDLVRKNDTRVKRVDVLIRFMQKHAPKSRKVTLGQLVAKYGQGELGLQG